MEVILGAAYFFDKRPYDINVSNATSSNESLPSKWNNSTILPVISTGYRFQKPKGGLVFRTGIGYPEGVYLSLGYAF